MQTSGHVWHSFFFFYRFLWFVGKKYFNYKRILSGRCTLFLLSNCNSSYSNCFNLASGKGEILVLNLYCLFVFLLISSSVDSFVCLFVCQIYPYLNPSTFVSIPSSLFSVPIIAIRTTSSCNRLQTSDFYSQRGTSIPVLHPDTRLLLNYPPCGSFPWSMDPSVISCHTLFREP